jgi:phosphate transport system permease protein
MVRSDPGLVGRTVPVWLPLSDDADMLIKGYIPRDVPEIQRRVSDQEIAWLDDLAAKGEVERRSLPLLHQRRFARPNWPSSWAAASARCCQVVTIAIASRWRASAVYLEEFAPKNRWTDLIEVNINNLAAVPSIVFGLLGLAGFLNFFGLPRSAPLVGGLVLAIMTLPTIIIAGRAALTSVPPSIREAAYGLGASPVQAVLHHVLPLAMPGMLTGASSAWRGRSSETAPLLMIGMGLIVTSARLPGPATVLPVQVFLWADSPSALREKTSRRSWSCWPS